MSSPTDLASAAQALAAALSASATDADDAMRLLAALANFTPSAATPASAIGANMAIMQSAIGDLCRRAAVVELAIASSTYLPASRDDAANVRSAVCGLLDNEILIAGDQGEDAVFNSLRALRAAVVQDLTARGAGLASIQAFKIGAALPASVVAQRLYRDPSRADELVVQANPPHPAFMPASFKALSK